MPHNPAVLTLPPFMSFAASIPQHNLLPRREHRTICILYIKHLAWMFLYSGQRKHIHLWDLCGTGDSHVDAFLQSTADSGLICLRYAGSAMSTHWHAMEKNTYGTISHFRTISSLFLSDDLRQIQAQKTFTFIRTYVPLSHYSRYKHNVPVAQW